MPISMGGRRAVLFSEGRGGDCAELCGGGEGNKGNGGGGRTEEEWKSRKPYYPFFLQYFLRSICFSPPAHFIRRRRTVADESLNVSYFCTREKNVKLQRVYEAFAKKKMKVSKPFPKRHWF